MSLKILRYLFFFLCISLFRKSVKSFKKEERKRKKKQHRLGKFYYNAQKALTFLLVWALFIPNFAIKKKVSVIQVLKNEREQNALIKNFGKKKERWDTWKKKEKFQRIMLHLHRKHSSRNPPWHQVSFIFIANSNPRRIRRNFYSYFYIYFFGLDSSSLTLIKTTSWLSVKEKKEKKCRRYEKRERKKGNE